MKNSRAVSVLVIGDPPLADIGM